MQRHGVASRFPTHFDGQRFFNPGAPQVPGFFDALRWKLTSRPERSPKFIADVVPCKPPACVTGEELRVTMINHSTVLLQFESLNILTDPVWAERASPFQFAGPRRRRAPGVRFEDLPRIDIVLVSHNHYDHLDVTALQRLAGRAETRFIVPLRLARFMNSRKIDAVEELDWGESMSRGCTRIHSVPAMHFSARGLFDRNKSLWCGYVIEAPRGFIYFAADTGFGAHFESIHEIFGAPRLALLPIGAYDPRWFMAPVHMAPDDAVRAHRILAARTSIAIHHGTFQLTDEGIDEPKRIFEKQTQGDAFLVLANGQSVTLA